MLQRVSLIVVLLLARSTAGGGVSAGFDLELLTDELDRPVGLAVLPDGRILITEQDSGEIRLYADGALRDQPAATVATLGAVGCGESGLLGIAVHPGFSKNGYFYVFYTDATDSAHVVSRFTMEGDTAGDETPILALYPTTRGDGNSCANHNGGYLAFGSDGFLYITNGERQIFQDASPDPTDLLGKTLRVTDAGDPAPGNPFDNEVWTVGHRNSYGIAFHAVTGGLYETENGPQVDDEINYLVAGDDYGWPSDTGDNTDPDLHDPIHIYPSPICVAGITSYGGGAFPDAMDGDLFYADCNTGRIHRMRISPDDPELIEDLEEDFAEVDGATIDVKWSAFDGALYFTAIGYGSSEPGRLYRIRYVGSGFSDDEGRSDSGCSCQFGARP